MAKLSDLHNAIVKGNLELAVSVQPKKRFKKISTRKH